MSLWKKRRLSEVSDGRWDEGLREGPAGRQTQRNPLFQCHIVPPTNVGTYMCMYQPKCSFLESIANLMLGWVDGCKGVPFGILINYSIPRRRRRRREVSLFMYKKFTTFPFPNLQ